MKIASNKLSVFKGSIYPYFTCFIWSCNTADPLFEIENDLTILQIEDLPAHYFKDQAWELGTTYKGFHGNGYAIWKGTAISGNDSQPGDEPDRYLRLKIRIKEAGTYFIKLRNYHQSRDGDNDVFIRTPGQEENNFRKYYDHDVNAWTLDETGDWATHQLEKGTHMLEIAGRSHGFAIDELLIYKEGTVLPQPPVNPNASTEARELLSYLYEVKETGGILSGLHHDQIHPHQWDDTLRSRIGNVVPAIWGNDFRYGWHIVHRQRIIDEAIIQHRKGRIITFMYHQVRPMDDETCCGRKIWRQSIQGNITDEDMDSLITEGSELHSLWKAKWDTVATYLQQLEDAKVPVLFRPYHEMNGGWFWWGKKAGFPKDGTKERDHSQDKFKTLYRMTYHLLTEEKGLDNLIWVLNYDDENNDLSYYYPGDNYVDVVATDIYFNKYNEAHLQALRKIAGEKPIAIGEISGLPPMDELKTTYTDFIWFMGWRKLFFLDLNEDEEGQDTETLKKIFYDDYVINLDDLER